MSQLVSAIKDLRADLVGASHVFLVYADMNIGITQEEVTIVHKMVTAQIDMVEDLALLNFSEFNGSADRTL